MFCKKMYGSAQQKGCLSVFYSLGSSPLTNWFIHAQSGYSKRLFDDDLKSVVLELMGTNVSTMYMEMPHDPKVSLGIKLPFLVMLIKNLGKYFTFEVKIIDDQRFCRRFRASNFQSSTSVKPFSTVMPMGMSPGWNQIHFNLADFTRRAYGTNYMETVHLQIHANVRIRRIYFTDRLYTEDELPNDFRLNPKPKERPKKEYKVPAARPPSPIAKATPLPLESENKQTDESPLPAVASVHSGQEAAVQSGQPDAAQSAQPAAVPNGQPAAAGSFIQTASPGEAARVSTVEVVKPEAMDTVETSAALPVAAEVHVKAKEVNVKPAEEATPTAVKTGIESEAAIKETIESEIPPATIDLY